MIQSCINKSGLADQNLKVGMDREEGKENPKSDPS